MYVTKHTYTLKGDDEMLNAKFGIEIEFTGITREKAAKVAAKFLEEIHRRWNILRCKESESSRRTDMGICL